MDAYRQMVPSCKALWVDAADTEKSFTRRAAALDALRMCKDDANETCADSRQTRRRRLAVLIGRHACCGTEKIHSGRGAAILARSACAALAQCRPADAGPFCLDSNVFVGLARVLHPKSPLSGKARVSMRRASVVGGYALHPDPESWRKVDQESRRGDLWCQSDDDEQRRQQRSHGRRRRRE